jgi:D-tyrosyl-tRNA(Tyr) deacylase
VGATVIIVAAVMSPILARAAPPRCSSESSAGGATARRVRRRRGWHNRGVRAVVQRVTRARVTVAGEVVGQIDAPGLAVLVGVTHDDDSAVAQKMAEKLWGLRILDGERSCSDVGAPLLIVSQFTLYGDARKGRRPSWVAAAPGAVAEPLVDAVVAGLRALGATVATGAFGAMMQVELVNDGPFTVLLDL